MLARPRAVAGRRRLHVEGWPVEGFVVTGLNLLLPPLELASPERSPPTGRRSGGVPDARLRLGSVSRLTGLISDKSSSGSLITTSSWAPVY